MMQPSSDKRAAMGERGRRFGEREFGRAKFMSSLESWVQELIEARPS